MSAQDNGGPAFPFGVKVIRRDGYGGGEITLEENEGGMTLRDYFAAKAMQKEWREFEDPIYAARRAYLMADAMLKARTA